MSFIPYGKQTIEQEDVDAVVQVLTSDWLTQGPAITAFEKAIQEYCHAEFATAVCNATAALHLACCALELGSGDVLWTTPNTFVASANCARYCGADVDFVDIDPITYNLCADALEKKLQQAELQGKLPKVVVPVHFAGQSPNMQKIKALADKYSFKIIEDASHAIGAKYYGQPVGGCQYADITIFSFHPVKIMTTAEGGLATTNDAVLDCKMKLLRSHGVTRDADLMQSSSEGPWYYQQVALGFNYRITDLQCALGLSQLQRLDQFVEKRNQLVQRYHVLLKELPLILPALAENNDSSWHLYVIQLDQSKTSVSRKALFEALRAANIGVNVHYIPVHLQPYYQNLGFKEGDFPQAEFYYEQAISLPLYFTLTNEEQDFVVETLKQHLC